MWKMNEYWLFQGIGEGLLLFCFAYALIFSLPWKPFGRLTKKVRQPNENLEDRCGFGYGKEDEI